MSSGLGDMLRLVADKKGGGLPMRQGMNPNSLFNIGGNIGVNPLQFMRPVQMGQPQAGQQMGMGIGNTGALAQALQRQRLLAMLMGR